MSKQVIDCCDRMIRPYSCIAPVVSARLLLSQGKGATLPPSAMCPQPKNVQALVIRNLAPTTQAAPPRLRQVLESACAYFTGLADTCMCHQGGNACSVAASKAPWAGSCVCFADAACGNAPRALPFVAFASSRERMPRKGGQTPGTACIHLRVCQVPIGSICGSQCGRQEV